MLGADDAVAVGGDARAQPAFGQDEAPIVGLVGLGFLELPVQHRAAIPVIGGAVVAGRNVASDLRETLRAGNARVLQILAGMID